MIGKLIACLLAILLLDPTQTLALSSNWEHDGPVDVRLISSLEGVGQKTVIPLGLEVRMEPGWHTYWSSPGAAGLPPQFDWSKSLDTQHNLKHAAVYFPIPRRFNDEGIDTIGYQSRVLFPIDAEVITAGLSLTIDAHVTLLVCSDMCVPKSFDLNLLVPHDSAIEGPEADILNPARKLVPPEDEQAAGIRLENVVNNRDSLSFTISSDTAITAPDVFVEDDKDVGFQAPQWKAENNLHETTLTVRPDDPKQDLSLLGGVPMRVTIVVDGDKHAVAVNGTIPPLANSSVGIKFEFALLMAFLGGFLLNLMPCVLPVLSLKILSFIGHGGGEAKAVRRSFLVTAAGIVFSFALLALVTIALKALGMTLGWGVQFQQPLFLVFLIFVLMVFAANMLGLFEINLPAFLADKLAAHHPKMAGDFATGALATLLATPCTAPFMGTAVGFALASGSSREIIGIFLMLGIGMVIPYLAIAAFPGIATLLPKPGAWMVRLRYALGGVLALTAVWIMWILSAQILTACVIGVALCAILMIVFITFFAGGTGKPTLIGMAGLIVVAIVLTLYGTRSLHDARAESDWKPFDEASIEADVASGHTVFVDITADWCLTCKANQNFVLSNDDLTQRILHSPNVIPMQGDWTTRNDTITNYLHKFGRSGIPFNVVYGPFAKQGITLPEILTYDAVSEALRVASGQQ